MKIDFYIKKEINLKNYSILKLALLGTLLLYSFLFLRCAGTKLYGKVYTPEKVPAKNMDILVTAEPGGKTTSINEDGSFVLKGLDSNTVYTITAICKTDNTRARIRNVFVKKGENWLRENEILILAIHIPPEPVEDSLVVPQDEEHPPPIPEKP